MQVKLQGKASANGSRPHEIVKFPEKLLFRFFFFLPALTIRDEASLPYINILAAFQERRYEVFYHYSAHNAPLKAEPRPRANGTLQCKQLVSNTASYSYILRAVPNADSLCSI